jgi:mevalonate kinase
MIKATAPGKLMLFGEHAVVHGRPCIATAVDYRISVYVEKRKDDVINLNAPDMGVKNQKIKLEKLGKIDDRKSCFVLCAVKNFFEKFNVKNGLNIKTKSEFSCEYGLGSSSAVTVCTIGALARLFNINMSKKDIFDLSYKTVLDIQKRGSGYDIATALYGGTIFFRKGGTVIEKIKTNGIPLIVGYTGIKADTAKLVKFVEEKEKRYPELMNPVFDLVEIIVLEAKKYIENKDFDRLGGLMNFNHGLLAATGVSSKELEKLIFAARNAGAAGAKLSGAGGGDCMIAIANGNARRKVEQAIRKAGGKVLEVRTNADGLIVEPKG